MYRDTSSVDCAPRELTHACCPQDVPVKALRVLFLLDTLSATWLLCLLNDSEVSRWTPMEGILRFTLGSQAYHAHSLEDYTRSIQQSTSTHTYCELCHQTIHKQCQTRKT